MCRGAGDRCSGDEGWAARPVVLLFLPGDLYLQWWQVLYVVNGFIAAKI